MVGLPVEVLPEIRKTKEIVGTVREEVSKQTGLPGGLPVIAGCSDTAAEDFSAGAVKMVRLSLSWQLPAMSIWLQTRRCLTIRHLHTPILWKEMVYRYGYQQLCVCVPLDEGQSLPCGKGTV